MWLMGRQASPVKLLPVSKAPGICDLIEWEKFLRGQLCIWAIQIAICMSASGIHQISSMIRVIFRSVPSSSQVPRPTWEVSQGTWLTSIYIYSNPSDPSDPSDQCLDSNLHPHLFKSVWSSDPGKHLPHCARHDWEVLCFGKFCNSLHVSQFSAISAK